MPKSYNHAVTAKARALYGRRITPEQYKDLLRCRNVPEVASYLKSSTSYADALQNISESNIHRGQLENMLRRWNFDSYAKMYYYLNSNEIVDLDKPLDKDIGKSLSLSSKKVAI